jgi:hypothetical protein
MPGMGLEPMIPLFERAKTVHALDRAVTLIGYFKPFYAWYKRRHFKIYSQNININSKRKS